MPKQHPMQISLPTPCSQNWDEMMPREQGRFCDHCQHTVIDFTTWSDAALYNFFSKDNGHVCGRFTDQQLDRPINIPHQPYSRLYRLTITLGLTLMLAHPQHLLAQNRTPITQSTIPPASVPDEKKNYPTDDTLGQLYGTIIDEKKDPLISAAVQLFKGNTRVAAAVTDYDGNYLMKDVPPGLYKMVVLYTGHDTLTIAGIPVKPGERTIQNGTMIYDRHRAELPIIIHSGRPTILNQDEPTKRVYTRDDLNKMR